MGARMMRESYIRKNAKAIVLLLFVGIIFADVIVGIYLLKDRITTPVLSSGNSRIYLPVILNLPELVVPTATPEPPTATPSVTVYIVQAGDTLGEIAKDHGITVDELAQANQIENIDLIYSGQELIIPVPANPTATPTPDAAITDIP